MGMQFFKLHGLGNDFVLVDARAQQDLPDTAAFERLGHRTRGIGFDQYALLTAGNPTDNTDFTALFFNRNGEPVACGNGNRSVAGWWMDTYGSRPADNPLSFQTHGGLIQAWREDAKSRDVTVDMGLPRLEWQEIPLSKACDTLEITAEVAGDFYGAPNPVAVSMGNPHLVFFVPDVAMVDLADIGSKLEHHPIAPQKANIEFVQILDRGHVRMRVWERGTGITEACGTGACAVAVAAIRRGLTDTTVLVHLDGGDLTITWDTGTNAANRGHVLMSGGFETVFEGTLVS